MTPFTKHTGIVLPLDRDNIDTDAIIPKQFMKSIARTGFGPYLLTNGVSWTKAITARLHPSAFPTPNARSISHASPMRRFCWLEKTSVAEVPANMRRGRFISSAFG